MFYSKISLVLALLAVSCGPKRYTSTEVTSSSTSSISLTPDPSSALAEFIRRRAAMRVCAVPSGAKVGDVVGISSHMEQAEGFYPARDVEISYIVQNKMRVRQDFLWEQIEPAPNQWRFSAVEGQVSLAKKHGIQLTALISYRNAWAMTNPADDSTLDPQLFGRFAGKVAERYCDVIHSYEIWNEPDNTASYRPVANPAHYGELLKAAAASIRKTCPSATIISAGLTNNAPGGKLWWFMEKVAEAHPDICSSFDALGLHPYTADQRFSPEQEMTVFGNSLFQNVPNMLKRGKELLNKIGCEQKPLWITEAGWPSYANFFQGLGFQITKERQADYLARGLLLALKEGVSTWFWYTFKDEVEPEGPGPRLQEYHFGLFFPFANGQIGQPKPAALTYSRVVKELAAYRFSADVSSDFALPAGVYALLFIAEDCTRKIVFWDGREDLFADALGLSGSTFSVEKLVAPEGFLWLSANSMREGNVEWEGAWTPDSI